MVSVSESLGADGTGEVYRARETELDGGGATTNAACEV